MTDTIQKSRYWRFKVIEKDAVDGWGHMVLNYPTIISPCHKRDAKPEFFKQNNHKTLRKADQLDQIKKPLSHTLVWFNNKYQQKSRI